MADSDDDCPACPTGLPAWLATFADLMSLLMCFFVLLLSFSEMDLLKYKQIAGSMSEAFGVQNSVQSKDIPKGTSIIAQEFSPGRPEPTIINEVIQSTTDVTQAELNVSCPTGETPEEKANNDDSAAAAHAAAAAKALADIALVALETEKTAIKVAAALSKEVKSGQIEIETDGVKLVIRIKDQGAFESGSANLRANFIPILARIRDILRGIKGVYAIEGHTDNLPIRTVRFRSNWELSASRAVSVAHELLVGGYLEEARFNMVGYGSVRPLVANTTAENRAKNRRVEIVVQQGKEPDWEQYKISDSEQVQGIKKEIMDPNNPPIFKFDENEIF